MSKISVCIPAQGHHRAAPAVRAAIVLLAMFVAALTAASAASAYWSAVGSTSTVVVTGTLAPPTDVTVSATATTDVPVSWTTATSGIEPAGYYITRHTGATAVAACESSPSSLIDSTVCTDTTVPDGAYTYVVTSVFGTWTAPSASSGSVTVMNAAALAFTTQPSDTTAGTSITPPVEVALQTATGAPFSSSGTAVTIAIAVNPADGTLTGTTTVMTDATGVASFDDLAIDNPAGGYTLTATTPGRTPATSEPFEVSAPPLLGAAQGYSVLAATAVVSSGATTVSGDLGVSPGTSITGFGPDVVGGDIHAGDAHAARAQDALVAAYDDLAGRIPDTEFTGDLGGLTLTPGTYHSAAALALTGALTLDALGDPNAVFVFQTDAAFNTAAASTVTLINGAQASDVFWVVTGAAGTGASSFLSGTILALGAITLGASTELIGQALSRDAITLAASTIRFTVASPPALTIDGGTTAVTTDTTPIVAGSSDAPESSPVTVRIAGQTLATTVGADGTWSVTATTLAAGSHDIVAKVRDANGNGTNAFQTLIVQVNPTTIALGTVGTYSVLAGTSVVNTGATVLSGDLGVSPGSAVTGFPPGTLDGAIHAGDPAAAEAQDDLLAAFDDGFARIVHTEITGDLGGRTFHVGVHHSIAALALTGTLTLDGEGDPGAVFIFQTDAAFNTAAASTVTLINGAQASNVFWVVTGAAGTGANSVLSGTILARGAITLGADTALTGQALSRDTVTLAGNAVSGTTPAPTILLQPAEPDASGAERFVGEPGPDPGGVATK